MSTFLLSLLTKVNKKFLIIGLGLLLLLGMIGYTVYLKKSLDHQKLQTQIAHEKIDSLKEAQLILNNKLLLERKLSKQYQEEKDSLDNKYTAISKELESLELTNKQLVSNFKKERDRYENIKNNLINPDFYYSFMCKHGYVETSECGKTETNQ